MLGRTSLKSCSAQSIFCATSIPPSIIAYSLPIRLQLRQDVLVPPEYVLRVIDPLDLAEAAQRRAVGVARIRELILTHEVHVLAAGQMRLQRGEASPHPCDLLGIVDRPLPRRREVDEPVRVAMRKRGRLGGDAPD